MKSQMFLNLAVKDLNKSMEFFTKLGFKFEQKFTDEKAACMIVNDGCYVMLITDTFFKTFTNKDICNTKECTEVLISISVESIEKVNELVDIAINAGATTYREPQDMGWMYLKSIEDPDRHQWEIFYMDMTKMPLEMSDHNV